MKFFRFLWAYLPPYRGQYFAAMMLTFAEAMLVAAPPLAVGLGLAHLIKTPGDVTGIMPYSLTCFAAVFLRILVVQKAWFKGFSAGDHATEVIRNKIVEHMRKVPLGTLTGRWGPARIATLIAEDGRWFNETSTFYLIRFFNAIVATIVFTLLAALFAPITLIALALSIGGGLVMMRVAKPLAARFIQARNTLISDATLRAGEFADGIAVFRAFGQNGTAQKKFRAAVVQMHEIALNMAPILVTLQMTGTALVSFATPLAIVCIATIQLNSGTGKETDFVAPALFLTLAAATLFNSGVLNCKLPLEIGRRARLNISDFLDTPELTGTEQIGEHDLSVEFESVGFTYAGEDTNALTDLSFKIPQGSFTAVVGPSGAGKSTLVSVLMRFHDRTAGKVQLGNLDSSQINPAAIQEKISLVSQDVHLFRDTLRANLLLGDPNADVKRLRQVIAAARLDDLIEALPEGLDTVLGDTGRTLSGGERQRVAIARAMLKDAPIIILDEATSAMDPITERAIQDALGALETGRTVIVIAHRLHTIMDADQILVMKDGRIVERGTHGDLMSADGLYTRLWMAQEKASGWRLR